MVAKDQQHERPAAAAQLALEVHQRANRFVQAIAIIIGALARPGLARWIRNIRTTGGNGYQEMEFSAGVRFPLEVFGVETVILGPAIGLPRHLHPFDAVEASEAEPRIDLIAQPKPAVVIVKGPR